MKRAVLYLRVLSASVIRFRFNVHLPESGHGWTIYEYAP
jgi:hypothetical protein